MSYNVILKPEAERNLLKIKKYSEYNFGKSVYEKTKQIIENAIDIIQDDPYINESIFYKKNEKKQIEFRIFKIKEERRKFGMFYCINEKIKTVYILCFYGLSQDSDSIFSKQYKNFESFAINPIKICNLKEKSNYLESFTNKFLADIDKMNQQIIEDFRNSL